MLPPPPHTAHGRARVSWRDALTHGSAALTARRCDAIRAHVHAGHPFIVEAAVCLGGPRLREVCRRTASRTHHAQPRAIRARPPR